MAEMRGRRIGTFDITLNMDFEHLEEQITAVQDAIGDETEDYRLVGVLRLLETLQKKAARDLGEGMVFGARPEPSTPVNWAPNKMKVERERGQ